MLFVLLLAVALEMEMRIEPDDERKALVRVLDVIHCSSGPNPPGACVRLSTLFAVPGAEAG